MSCRALIAVLLAGLSTSVASAECAPQVRLYGGDPVLIAKIQSAFDGTDLRAVTDRFDEDGDWTCPVLEVSLKQAGDRIEIVAQDASGTQLRRTVREAETAVALIESWTVVQPEHPTHRGFAISIRPELAFGGHVTWGADPAIGVSASLVGDWALELNLRGGLSQPSKAFAVHGDFEVVLGPARMFRFRGWALSLSGGLGVRQVVGPTERSSLVFEPALALLYALSQQTDLEVRVAPQATYVLGSELEIWTLGFRFGVGFRWSLR